MRSANVVLMVFSRITNHVLFVLKPRKPLHNHHAQAEDQKFQALHASRKTRVPDPSVTTYSIHSGWFHTSAIPNTSFATVDAYSRFFPKSLCHNIVHHFRAVGQAHYVDIVENNEYFFIYLQLRFDLDQCLMLSQNE